jgi:hypothetical protein
MYTVWRYFNGDRIHQWPNGGRDLGHAEKPTPNEELVVGGGSSEWLWSGGSADC